LFISKHMLTSLAVSLFHLYTKAKQTAVEWQEHFHGLCILCECTLVEKWQTEPLKHIKREVNGTVYINSRREKVSHNKSFTLFFQNCWNS
jgi:hypothetical protein